MKPPAFTVHRPATVGEALATLADLGSDGKVLAGGQSLVPMLNMRLATPPHLVDINRLAELDYVHVGPDGVRVGALARHRRLERDRPAYAAIPLLRRATACVAHAAIRNRGTTVGSLVHADPAAELPAVLTLLAGSVELTRVGGTGAVSRRTVPAREFFRGPLESALEPGELATEARFPVPPPASGTAWLEVSRRQGDYALCGVGVLVTLDADRRITAASAAYISVGAGPVAVDLTEAVVGRHADAADWSAAAALASAAVHPEDDIHATAAYRRHLVGVLTRRAARAAAEAADTPDETPDETPVETPGETDAAGA